ncbi:MAG: PLP-dependent transferase [Tannerella sp.]|jgi:O-acetylhomoserine (thiol)-lyase|nr:PLP-dependent transferase [Tannerella sp.]
MREDILSALSPETRAVHTPFPADDAYGSLNMPVYQTVAYEFQTAAQMERAFTGRSAEHVYSRISNPSVQYFENRVKVLTGGADVVAFASGMAAIVNTFMAIAYAGCNIVTSPHLFGNTYSLLATTLKDFGVEARFCDLTRPEEVNVQIDGKTCAVFLEVITNPQMEVADLLALSALCREKGVPLIADTTIVPFTVFHAGEFGVDIEIVSSTKYISGGATSLGGLILDYHTFDWRHSPKLAPLVGEFKDAAFLTKMRREIHRNLGAYMSPQAASFQTLGLESLTVRYRQAAKTCQELAERLTHVEGVVSVNYPGLASHPHHAVSQAQFGDCPGAMLTFDLVSREACFRFIDCLQLIRRATNLFDNKTLAIHPASTIFGTFSEKVRQSMDISQQTIRLSVGLEHADDLFEDLQQAVTQASNSVTVFS